MKTIARPGYTSTRNRVITIAALLLSTVTALAAQSHLIVTPTSGNQQIGHGDTSPSYADGTARSGGSIQTNAFSFDLDRINVHMSTTVTGVTITSAPAVFSSSLAGSAVISNVYPDGPVLNISVNAQAAGVYTATVRVNTYTWLTGYGYHEFNIQYHATHVSPPPANPTGFGMQRWSDNSGWYWNTQKWLTGDFNGDGKADLANVFNEHGLANIDVHLSNNGSFSHYRWATHQGGIWQQMQWFVGDFNGDGRDDLAKAFNDGGLNSIDVHISTGAGFIHQRWATRQGGFWDSQRWFAGDFNGDGIDDCGKIWNDWYAASIDIHLSTAHSFGIARWATRQGGYNDSFKVIIGDFNGDGRDDIGCAFNDGGLASIDVRSSLGYGFHHLRWATRQGGFWDAMRWFAGDVDGDGRDDIGKVWNEYNKASIDIHPSTGASFGIQRWMTQQGPYSDAQQWVIGDFTGDNREEPAKVFLNPANNITAAVDVHAHLYAASGGNG